MPPATPLTGAETVHPDSKQNIVPQIEYSDAAKVYIQFRRARMIAARDVRDTSHPEFDDMTFLRYYDVLKKADDQYVAPRKNKQDTSINTGTIRDKDTSLLEYAMKYDFEPVAQVFDDTDEMLEELAETGEDLVRKSKLMEDYRSKAKLIYRSMVAFGTALVEDHYVERWTLEKTFGKGGRPGDVKSEWSQRYVKSYDGCQAKLWDLRKCYFGDIRKFFMNGPEGQPYFFTVEYQSYDVVKSIFKDWDRWKYVPNIVVATPEVTSVNTYSPSWTLQPVSLNYVEIIRYYDPVANEYALTLNGIDMLPIMDKKITENGMEKQLVSGFPLTAISPSGAIPFAKFDLEPMHESAYSKSQPGKMRVWGDVENMFVKLMIQMFKQKAKPTMGNKSNRQFGEEVTDPGTTINDIRDGDLFPILPNFKGPEPADFSMYELVKKELDKNSVERSFQGMDNPSPQDETATKDMNDIKAQSLKVAALFDGIVFGENQLAWLRTYNIAKNWTKPVDFEVDTFRKTLVQKFRKVTMPSEIDGGQKVKKQITFTKDTTMTPEDVHQEEVDYQKKNGTEIRIKYLHPELYAQMRMNWFYRHVPVPNSYDPLSYMMFAKQIKDAMTFFGPDSTNVKRLKHRFAAMTGNDFDTWFLSEEEVQQKRTDAARQNAMGGTDGMPGNEGINPQDPTIAKASRGAVPQLGTLMK